MNLFDISSSANLSAGVAILWILLIVWSMVWKGIALWKAAKQDSLAWFIVLVAVNTVGILEILYIFVFSKMGKKTGS